MKKALAFASAFFWRPPAGSEPLFALLFIFTAHPSQRKQIHFGFAESGVLHRNDRSFHFGKAFPFVHIFRPHTTSQDLNPENITNSKSQIIQSVSQHQASFS
ncbi:MAG: hypothetical protein IKJ91_10770 [Clostridia bacterium]|nr:hypothetical protein [Clostridia bacterium]